MVRDHWLVIRFCPTVNFVDICSVLTKKSKSTVQQDTQTLHQCFRAQATMLLSPSTSPWSQARVDYGGSNYARAAYI